MELGRSGRRDDAGSGCRCRRRRSSEPATGPSPTIAKSAAPTEGALARARSAPRPPRHGKISRIWPRCLLAAVTRAHSRETRRLLTNRPGSNFSTKSPIPTNVYASAIGLCKDSMIMQSRKPSNSDLTVFQHAADPTRVRTVADKEFDRDPTRPSPNNRRSAFQGQHRRSVTAIQLRNEYAIDRTYHRAMNVMRGRRPRLFFKHG